MKDRETGLGFRHLNGITAKKRDRVWFLVSFAYRFWLSVGKVGEMLHYNKKVQNQEGELHLFNRGRQLAKYHRWERRPAILELFWSSVLHAMLRLIVDNDRSIDHGFLILNEADVEAIANACLDEVFNNY